ncbi:MAG: hypothetical protein ACREXU_00060 [Gammaproteobacteria bacterium]
MATKQRAAAEVARDNQRRDGGLLAAAAMQEAAAGRPDYPEVQRVADEMLGHYTFYRDLLPTEKHSTRGQYLGWFLPRGLQDPRDFGRGITVAEQHREELLSRIGEAHFVPLPGGAGVHRYPLPERFAPGWLRVVVDGGGMSRSSRGPRRFLLRLEGQDPIAFEVDPSKRLSEDQFAPSLAHAGLSLLAATDPGGPLSAWWPRGTPVDGVLMEIPLPPEPREIQVWSEDPGAGGLGVALQYRASRRFQLSEARYLEWARATRGPLRAFRRLLTPSASPASALDQHWLPLVRFLQSRGRMFGEGVAPGPSHARAEPLAHSEKAKLLGRLTRERDSRQSLAAFESLSRLAAGSRGRERLGYELQRVEALLDLREIFLAEHMLRGLVLHGPDPETRAAAERRLREHYRETEDSDALIALLAARVVEAGDIEHVRALAEVLIEAGEIDAGLALGLLLPEEQRPREAMLRAALGLRAWRVYGDSLARVKDPRERALWTGLRALAEGDHDAAEARFAAAGPAGLAWSEALGSARSIHAARRKGGHHPRDAAGLGGMAANTSRATRLAGGARAPHGLRRGRGPVRTGPGPLFPVLPERTRTTAHAASGRAHAHPARGAAAPSGRQRGAMGRLGWGQRAGLGAALAHQRQPAGARAQARRSGSDTTRTQSRRRIRARSRPSRARDRERWPPRRDPGVRRTTRHLPGGAADFKPRDAGPRRLRTSPVAARAKGRLRAFRDPPATGPRSPPVVYPAGARRGDP